MLNKHMRLREFAEQDILLEHMFLTEEEQQARFKFLSMASAKLKGAAEKAVTAVHNTADAMRLLYQVVKDPQTLIKAITLLRQALSQLLANAHATIKGFLNKILPKTNNLTDFFKTLLIYAGVAGVSTVLPRELSRDFVHSAFKDALIKFTNLDTVVNTLMQSGASNIMPVLNSLKITYELFFDVLSRIAKLLGSVKISKSGGVLNLAKVVEAKGRKSGGWYLIKMVNSKHEPTEVVTADNYDEMTSFYANPHPRHAYLGFVNGLGEVTHHLVTNDSNQINIIPGKPW